MLLFTRRFVRDKRTSNVEGDVAEDGTDYPSSFFFVIASNKFRASHRSELDYIRTSSMFFFLLSRIRVCVIIEIIKEGILEKLFYYFFLLFRFLFCFKAPINLVLRDPNTLIRIFVGWSVPSPTSQPDSRRILRALIPLIRLYDSRSRWWRPIF